MCGSGFFVILDRMKLIGIGGTDGSGKDTIGEMLADEYGWLYVSVTDILRNELTKQKRELSRENLRGLSAQWRREHGMAVLIDKAIEAFENEKKHRELGGLAIASLRHPAEAERVSELGGHVVWIDADPRVRYKRIADRKRGTEDEVTFKEFLAEEKAQMSHSGDKATLNLSGVKEEADIFLENSGDDIEAFKAEAEKALSHLLN